MKIILYFLLVFFATQKSHCQVYTPCICLMDARHADSSFFHYINRVLSMDPAIGIDSQNKNQNEPSCVLSMRYRKFLNMDAANSIFDSADQHSFVTLSMDDGKIKHHIFLEEFIFNSNAMSLRARNRLVHRKYIRRKSSSYSYYVYVVQKKLLVETVYLNDRKFLESYALKFISKYNGR